MSKGTRGARLRRGGLLAAITAIATFALCGSALADYQLKFDSTITLTMAGGGDGSGSGTFTYQLNDTVPLKGGPSSFSGSQPETYSASGQWSGGAGCSPSPTMTIAGATPDTMLGTLNLDAKGKPEHLLVGPGLPNETYNSNWGCIDPQNPDAGSAQMALWLDGFDQFHSPGSSTGSGCTYDLLPGLEPGKGAVILQGDFTNSGSTDPNRQSQCEGSYSGAFPFFVWEYQGQYTFTENTQVTVEKVCPPGEHTGTVTFSEGDAPGLGTVVCGGDTISTGDGGRVEVTFDDGSIIRIGPDSQVTIDLTPGSDDIKLTNILGSIWASVCDAFGCEVEDTNGRGNAGNRGSSATFTALGGSQVLEHVISGIGFVNMPGMSELDFPSGQSFIVDLASGSVTPTSQWPAAAISLVPPAYAPPSVTGLSVRRPTRHAKGKLGFKLDQPAAVTVYVFKGKELIGKGAKAVFTKKLQGKLGKNTLALKIRHKGSYTVVVYASKPSPKPGDDALTGSAQKKFHVR